MFFAPFVGELRYRANAATPNVGRPMTPNSLPSSPIHGNAQQNARFMSPNFNPRAVGMVATSTPGASSSNGVSRAGLTLEVFSLSFLIKVQSFPFYQSAVLFRIHKYPPKFLFHISM